MLLIALLILALVVIAGGVFIHPWVLLLLLVLVAVAFYDHRRV